jgi:protocatechuate 3,4-dioxygenase beta subunit
MARVLACLTALFLIPLSTSAQVESGVVLGFSQGPSSTPARDTRPATGRSTIRGHIVAADSGQPVRRATVRITAPELRVPRSMLTDVNGQYEFAQLPAGRYSITASKNIFVTWSYGQTQPASPGKPVMLADNQTADNLNISLPRGAVLTGRVTDEFGEPVPTVFVSLMRVQFVQGQQRLMPAGNGNSPSTNDLGEYRMFGLTPGQYYVAAQPQQQAFPFPAIGPLGGQPEGADARTGYARTFYPGTADVSAAQKITVGIGQTIGEINIMLLPTRLATISGVAVNSQGQPFDRGNIQIMPRGGMVFGGVSGGPLKQDGTFAVPNVPPGQYTLRAIAPQGPPAPGARPAPPEFSVAIVSVNGEDVTDVRLTPVVPVTLSGRVSFDDPGAAQALKPSAIRVMAQALNPDDTIGFPAAPGPPPTLQDDFSFELKINPGRIGLRTTVQAAPGTPNGWQVKAVRVSGIDVTDSGVQVDARGATGIEIELTNRRQEMSGAVTDARGDPVKDYAVILFAQDRVRWGAPFNRYFATGRPGDDGRFKIATLPPGNYYAIALDRIDPAQSQDPEFLEGLTRQASTFSLTQGETRTLDLKLFTVQ